MRFSTFLMSVACLSACVPILGDDFEIVPGGGTGGTGANGSCTIGETTCADAATLSTCPAGQAVLEPCPAETPVCAGSACVVCEEGSARCSGDDVEVCTNQTWAPGESCDLGCDAGACLRAVDIGAGAAHTCAVLSNAK